MIRPTPFSEVPQLKTPRVTLGVFCLLLLVSFFNSKNAKAYATTADSIKVALTEGTNMALDLSPDKTTIAADIQGTIWSIPIAGGDAKALTDGMGDDRQPSWSPDGSKVAFQSFRDGYYHIWSVNKDGSGLKQITLGVFDEREPEWSPDGKSIVFSSDRAGNYDIWKMDLHTHALTQITKDPANDYCPSFSPDGSKITFISERTSAPGIYIWSSDGEKLAIKSAGKLAAPAFNPAGTHIFYNLSTGAFSSLQDLDIAAGTTTALTVTTGAGISDVFPFRTSWLNEEEYMYSADGKIKISTVGEKNEELVPFKAMVTVVTPKYARKAYDFNAGKPKSVKGIKGLNVSPDGKRYVFSALGDIWLLEKGNPIPKALTKDAYMDADPTWSPDGTQLAFLSDRSGAMNLWLHDIKTGKQTMLVKLDYDLNYPNWSPDGSKIAFYMGDSKNTWGRGTLQTVEVKTGKIEKIHESLFVPSQPSWSPDGQTIALSGLQVYSTRYREGINKFILVSLDKQPDRFVSPMPERSLGMRAKNGPAWSPDGKYIAYTQDGLLWTVPVDATGNIVGAPKVLTHELSEVPSWTADSKTIVFMATDTIKQITLADGKIETIPLNFKWDYKQPKEITVIHAGKVFDGKNEAYHTNVDIIVEGNRIREIVPHKAGRTGKLIDASDKTIIPGLFEMHTHQHAMTGEKLGRLWLSYGITSLRETGADPFDALERKESWDAGTLTGPREFFTGGLTDGSRIYYGLANSIYSTSQLDMELDRSVRLGYDMIKTYVRMPDILQQRITNFAHAHGLPVSSHEIFPAMRYGVDAVEHIGGTSRRGYSPKITAMNHSYQDVKELLLKSQMNITPTISLQGGYFAMASKDPDFYENKQFRAFYSTEFINEIKANVPMIEKMFPGYMSNFGQIQKTTKTLMASGARVTAGTDSPFVPYAMSLHTELQAWVDSGISPFETLRSATLWAAQAVGVSKDLGSLEKGKLADLVIVDGDPLVQIRDAWNVKSVMKNGIIFTIDDLLKRP
ncbi:DPP IV N-terminal domain-containing protein [Dyadobacter pollutisoli]|uniref:DPP IV N-terminal domain-containing protein n=1 Tax=Dyadobacter pollutisoli TaxID=2910158 RepID=A0A9E8NDQ5_9BACT|nr:DPP IV N-terminal domain-containing protein [Dyadobacter pollutisoli]WAC14093.1 DPP IV N-terminal domain-containing protein [Dyadobacter pollutisoli]